MKVAMGYVPFVGFVAAIILLIVEKDRAVKWQAVQALFLYVVFAAIEWGVVPMLSVTVVLRPLANLVAGVAGVGFLVVWLVLAVKASQKEFVKLPIISEWVDKLVKA